MPLYVIDTLKPKNGLDFPVVEAVDVAVDGYSSLADAVTHFATDTAIAALTAALDEKANTSDVNTAVANLQGQINQIVISASAESVVAPEVAAARVGSDGTEYSTLKERLDSEIAPIADGVEAINKTISNACEYNPNGLYRVLDIEYEFGSIEYDGTEISSDSTIRSDYIEVPNGIVYFKVPSGLQIRIYEYNSSRTIIAHSELKTGTFSYRSANYIRITVKKEQSDAISISEAKTVSLKKINTVDKIIFNISENAGKAARTGYGKTIFKPVFEYGDFTPGTLTPVNSLTTARTIKPMYVGSGLAKIKVDSQGFIFRLYDIDSSGNVVDYTTYKEDSEYYYNFKGEYAVFVVKHSDTSPIETSEDINVLSVEIKNNIYDLNVTLEKGGLASGATTYNIADHNSKIRTEYLIDLGQAVAFTIYDAKTLTNPAEIVLYWYNSAGEYLNYTDLLSASITDKIFVKTPANAAYLRIAFFSPTNIPKSLNIRFEGCETKPFEAKVSATQRNGVYGEAITIDIDDTTASAIRMLLPSSYNIKGKKTPVILWLDGSVSWTAWNGDFSQYKIDYLRYLRDEGFAVVSIFAWGYGLYSNYYNCAYSYPYPTPTCKRVVSESLKWLLDHYNLDAENVHVMSKSQGGQLALYLASNNFLNVKTIGMFSPVLDYLSMPGEAMYRFTRQAIAADVGFTNAEYYCSEEFVGYSDEAKAFYTENLNQLISMNEAWTGLIGGTAIQRLNDAISDAKTFWTEQAWENPERTDIYNHTDYAKIASVPVKIWGAYDDHDTPCFKMVEVVEQLKNGGSEAYMRLFPVGTGGHGCADAGSTRTTVTTALGVLYENIPVGWVENVQWIRSKNVKTT